MSKEDFKIANQTDWQNIHKTIFADNIPNNIQWTNIDDIIRVLNAIGSVNDSNHTFFPSGGGLDLDGAAKSQEQGCIELNFGGLIHIIKPKSLTFESIDKDFEWNYFRLEADTLKASGVYENLPVESFDEEVLEISPLQYLDRSHWDEGEYDGKQLPASARPVIRILKGSLVIFKKTSIYNANSSTYDARHEKLGAVKFKEHVMAAYKHLKNIK
jgi:serine/threonine-protein kinase